MTTQSYSRYTGPVDALVSYWITKMVYENADDQAPPEFNLPHGGASRALEDLVGLRGTELDMDPGTAFELGLLLADIVSKNPLEAGPAVRDAVEYAIRESAACREESVGAAEIEKAKKKP